MQEWKKGIKWLTKAVVKRLQLAIKEMVVWQGQQLSLAGNCSRVCEYKNGAWQKPMFVGGNGKLYKMCETNEIIIYKKSVLMKMLDNLVLSRFHIQQCFNISDMLTYNIIH